MRSSCSISIARDFARGSNQNHRQWILQKVIRELPLEFAVEAQKLLTLKLEHSVG